MGKNSNQSINMESIASTESIASYADKNSIFSAIKNIHLKKLRL